MYKLLTLAWCCLLWAAPPAWASRDHDQARQALQSGQVQSLHTILANVERQYPGVFLEAELEKEGDVWVYEIKILQTGGQRIKVHVNAATGQVIQTKPR